MSFVKMLNKNEMDIKIINEASVKADDKEIIQKPSKKKEEKPEDLLRAAGFKIKLVTPTSFGIQIEFAKQYDDDEITQVLQDYNIKIKNKSVFIVS